MADGRTRRLDKLRVGDEIYGTRRVGVYRRFVRTRVVAHWSVIKPAFRTTLEDGTILVTSGDHRFLSDRGWKFVTGTEHGKLRRPHLTTSNKLMGTGAFAEAVSQDEDYRRGYLCGMIRGDGHLGVYDYLRTDGKPAQLYQFRLALCDLDALVRARNYLLDFDISTCGFVFQAAAGARRTLHAIRASSISRVNSIYRLIAWPPSPTREWRAGFLAGIFDAEGSFSQTILRVSNTDSRIVGWICECLRAFDFRLVVEHTHFETRKPIDVVRLTGGLQASICDSFTR